MKLRSYFRYISDTNCPTQNRVAVPTLPTEPAPELKAFDETPTSASLRRIRQYYDFAADYRIGFSSQRLVVRSQPTDFSSCLTTENCRCLVNASPPSKQSFRSSKWSTFREDVVDSSKSAGDYPRGFAVSTSEDGTDWSSQS
jgi:hypothetical protein